MTYQLYTRIQNFDLPDQCFVSLDITSRDFRSNPPLSYYVRHPFLVVDDLVDFLLSYATQRTTLIVSHLLAQIACDTLRPIFPQIIRLIIIGQQQPHECENAEYFPDAQSLVDHLAFTFRNRRRLYITFDSWPVERTSHDLFKHTAKHLWYQYFYSILSRLNNTHIARDEMLASVRAFHRKQTEIVQRACVEFEQTYHSDDVIRWYTRESFLYLLLNRTLRSEDIKHIFALRFVISDLENYLRRNNHAGHASMTVYRGQQMHLEEVREIEANISGLIGLTAFWSTTRSKDNALRFAEIWPPTRTDPVERVLFSIDVPFGVYGTYADVHEYSTVRSELEVLFSYRSLFRVDRVRRCGNNQFWYIDVTLIDENDRQYLSIMHPWLTATKEWFTPRSFYTPRVNFLSDSPSSSNGSFLGFQLLMDMMLRLDQNEYAREELLLVCRNAYANDPVESSKIEKFAETYDPRDAIQWYTTDCFLYRLLNRSLTDQRIDAIFHLRYFIHDLHNQLAQLQLGYVHRATMQRPVLKLYRGLRMRLHDLHDLQTHEGDLVSTNTFLSTTSDYQAALCFAGDGHVNGDEYISMIFVITVDTAVEHSIPFAQIEYQSIFKDEDEVLFSMAAVFRVGVTREIRERLWTTELTLTPVDDEQWRVFTSHLYDW